MKLVNDYGASVCVRNAAGKNVFDVAEGLNLRQTLMKMVLNEEQRNGTAPVIAGMFFFLKFCEGVICGSMWISIPAPLWTNFASFPLSR